MLTTLSYFIIYIFLVKTKTSMSLPANSLSPPLFQYSLYHLFGFLTLTVDFLEK